MRDVLFLSLDLPYDRSKAVQEPLIIAVDEIEAISPREYSDGGISPKHGSAVRTRSGETFVVVKTPTELQDMLNRAMEAHYG